MKNIDKAAYLHMLASATVIERDPFGEKVLALPDGLLVKIFRRKRLLSSATVYPYALRFVLNARRLTSLGISTVTVLDAAYCAAVRRYLVTYQPLPGETLRKVLCSENVDCAALLDTVASYIAVLHDRGVFFRSLHFGNIIVSSDVPTLGLIDVADMSFCQRPLSARMRARNFNHILRYDVDRRCVVEHGLERFVRTYFECAKMPEDACTYINGRISNIVK